MAVAAWSKGISGSSWRASCLSTEYQTPHRRFRRPPLTSRMKMSWWVDFGAALGVVLGKA